MGLVIREPSPTKMEGYLEEKQDELRLPASLVIWLDAPVSRYQSPARGAWRDMLVMAALSRWALSQDGDAGGAS